jgi:hypothetical protein
MSEPAKYHWRKVSDDLHALRVTTSFGNSALFYARLSVSAHRKTAQWLLGRHGADVTRVEDNYQGSPLWEAGVADGAWGAAARARLERAAALFVREHALAFTDAFEEREGAVVLVPYPRALSAPPEWLVVAHRYGLRVRQLLPDAVLCELM